MNVFEAVALYESLSGADSYIIGFVLDSILYALPCTSIPAEYVKIEAMSGKNGGGASLRLRIRSKRNKTALIASGAYAIGTVEDLHTLSYKNDGIAFEKYIKERNGYTWERHDSKRFDKGGDMESVQIKLDGATLAPLELIARLAVG